MKILMTDDDSEDRLLALFAFKKLNAAHFIDFVANGQELIDYLVLRENNSDQLPDLILLDLYMPKKSGMEALKEIRSNSKLRQLDVIIFSASISEADKELSLKLGAKKYVVKPSNPEDLVEIFRSICDDLVMKPGWHYFIQQTDSKDKKRSKRKGK